jgi:acyclic terpene utilization AtuA family protein
MKTVRIGSGAGYSGDRIEPAVELAQSGDIQYLGFECLAERTIALAQREKNEESGAGFDRLREPRMCAVLAISRSNGIEIITNMGAANPGAAAAATAEIARKLGISGLKIAAVTGDDVLDMCRGGDFPFLEIAGRVSDLGNRVLSANAYLAARSRRSTPMGRPEAAGPSSPPAMWLRSPPCCCRVISPGRRSHMWMHDDETARDRPFADRRQRKYLEHFGHCLRPDALPAPARPGDRRTRQGAVFRHRPRQCRAL